MSGASTANGAAVIQYACGTATNQQWSFTDVTGGADRLTALHSGKVLDVTGNSSTDGAPLEQWSSNNGTNQQFRMQVAGSGRFGRFGRFGQWRIGWHERMRLGADQFERDNSGPQAALLPAESNTVTMSCPDNRKRAGRVILTST